MKHAAQRRARAVSVADGGRARPAITVWLGLGSNTGDRRAHLTAALKRLGRCGRIDAVSSVYTSEPVGYRPQRWFWNLVVRLRTRLSAHALVACAKRIEKDLGRVPAPRNRPRPIDVDLLLYGDAVIRTPTLEVPHPRMMGRAFVLRPLVEVDPGLEHPVTGERFADRLRTARLERTRRLFDGRELLRGLAALMVAVTLACGSSDPQARARRIEMLVDSLLPRLERLSGLEARDSVRVEVRTPAEVRSYVEHRLDQELPAAELESVKTVYALLGLLPDTLQLRQLLIDLYTEQIAGYYDPATRALHVIEGATAQELRPVLAHELVHALQDQHTNLDSLIDRARGNDRQVAAQAAIEGHATIVMFALLAEEAGAPVDPLTLPDPGVQLRAAFESSESEFPVFRDAPAIIRETLLFPYVAGASFVRLLWQHDATSPGMSAPLGARLPQSTEQVMDPERRFLPVRDEPTELRFDEPSPWQRLYENTLGAFETRVLFEAHLGPAARATEGWDGDRYVLLADAAGARALVWVSVLDDAAAASAFEAALRDLVASGRMPATGTVERLAVDNRHAVRLVLARDADPAAVPRPAVHCVDAQSLRIACPAPDGSGTAAADRPFGSDER
ncbi:MAG: 2-amino-4-hydroxy-6-hydroxymethyldihydropteridine diphosphokinase [Gemmatimonadetes bacterium]|nr:2-amino-4-hydroxy-6-hydroxymethyldihydropteridine diphosphokinase [Gemmatimonadota bacterium]